MRGVRRFWEETANGMEPVNALQPLMAPKPSAPWLQPFPFPGMGACVSHPSLGARRVTPTSPCSCETRGWKGIGDSAGAIQGSTIQGLLCRA